MLSEKPRVRIVGYCSLEQDNVLERFLVAGPRPLLELEGDYLIVIESDLECHIISSAYCVIPYYYAIHEGKLLHGDTVVDILRESGMPWSWNWEALANLVQLDYVIGNETLHTRIHRVPSASILHFKDGKGEVFSLSWEDVHRPSNGDPQEALRALNRSVRLWATGAATVSMSAGFDSRVILSSLLREKIRLTLLSMGGDDCQDATVPRLIASSLGLKYIQVELDAEGYLTYGKRIAYLTNGTMMAWHWHWYMFPLKANVSPKVPFLVGSFGEFARTGLLDVGVAALVADSLPPYFALRLFWRKMMKKRIFREKELAGMNPGFSVEFSRARQEERICRLVRLCHKQLLSGLDRFRAEQTARNFAGMWLKLVSASVSVRMPFLASGWVESVWKLPRIWKLGCRWHRWAIAENRPDLLRFPEEHGAREMGWRPPLSYWLRTGVGVRETIRRLLGVEKPFISERPRRDPSYAPYGEWFRSPHILGFIAENSPLLSDVMSRNAVDSIVEEQRIRGNRTAAIAFLLSLIFWKINLKEVYEATTPTNQERREASDLVQ